MISYPFDYHSACHPDDERAQDQPFTVKNPKLDSNSALAKKRRAKGQPLPQLQVMTMTMTEVHDDDDDNDDSENPPTHICYQWKHFSLSCTFFGKFYCIFVRKCWHFLQTWGITFARGKNVRVVTANLCQKAQIAKSWKYFLETWHSCRCTRQSITAWQKV